MTDYCVGFDLITSESNVKLSVGKWIEGVNHWQIGCVMNQKAIIAMLRHYEYVKHTSIAERIFIYHCIRISFITVGVPGRGMFAQHPLPIWTENLLYSG